MVTQAYLEPNTAVAHILAPRHGSEGTLREYGDILAQKLLANPQFHKRHAQVNREQLEQIAETNARNLLLSEIQSYGFNYEYNPAYACGQLVNERQIPVEQTHKRLEQLAHRFATLVGTPLRYDQNLCMMLW